MLRNQRTENGTEDTGRCSDTVYRKNRPWKFQPSPTSAGIPHISEDSRLHPVIARWNPSQRNRAAVSRTLLRSRSCSPDRDQQSCLQIAVNQHPAACLAISRPAKTLPKNTVLWCLPRRLGNGAAVIVAAVVFFFATDCRWTGGLCLVRIRQPAPRVDIVSGAEVVPVLCRRDAQPASGETDFSVFSGDEKHVIRADIDRAKVVAENLREEFRPRLTSADGVE